MEQTKDLLNDLIKHFNKKASDANREMTQYYEDEYGDNMYSGDDYPDGPIGDPKGMELETIGIVYEKVVAHLIARYNKVKK